METLIVNTNTLQSSGNDTQFLVQLRKTYKCVRMKLLQFSCQNYFSNIPLKYQDFSFETGAGLQAVTIVDWTPFSEIFNVLNAAQAVTVFSGSLDYHYIATINSTNAFSPVGLGWSLLGIQTFYPTQALALQIIPSAPISLAQSNYLYIRFNNLINAYQGEGAVSFRVPLSSESVYGGILALESDTGKIENNQEVQFFQQVIINNLDITLLDDGYQQINTINNNNSGFGLQMVLGLWDE